MNDKEFEKELGKYPITAIAEGLLYFERLKDNFRQPTSNDFVIDSLKMSESSRRKIFGERLRMIRQLRGLTQAELAKRIGVSKSFVTNCERGQREPSNRNLIAMVRVLGISADWLLDIPPVGKS